MSDSGTNLLGHINLMVIEFDHIPNYYCLKLNLKLIKLAS